MDWVNCPASKKKRTLHLSAFRCVWPEFSSTADFQQRGFELSGRQNCFHCPWWRRWIVTDKIWCRTFVSLRLVLCTKMAFFAASVLESNYKQGISAGKWKHLWDVWGLSVTENDMVTAMERYDQGVYQVKDNVYKISSPISISFYSTWQLSNEQDEAVKQWLHCSGQNKGVMEGYGSPCS